MKHHFPILADKIPQKLRGLFNGFTTLWGASVTVMIGFIFSSQALVDLAVYQNHCFSKLPSSPNNLSHKNQI